MNDIKELIKRLYNVSAPIADCASAMIDAAQVLEECQKNTESFGAGECLGENIAIYLSTDELSILYKAAYLTNQSLQSFVLNAAFLAANKDINAARDTTEVDPLSLPTIT